MAVAGTAKKISQAVARTNAKHCIVICSPTPLPLGHHHMNESVTIYYINQVIKKLVMFCRWLW
jgi:hypothetical protein